MATGFMLVRGSYLKNRGYKMADYFFKGAVLIGIGLNLIAVNLKDAKKQIREIINEHIKHNLA